MNPEQLYEAAVLAYHGGNAAHAKSLCREVLLKSPKHAEGLYFAGILAADEGANKEAIRLIRKAIEQVPGVSDYYTSLASLYLTVNDYSKAEQAYRKALEIDPENAIAYHGLGQVLWKMGSSASDPKEEVERCFERAISLAPDMEGAYHSLATFAFEIDDLRKTVEYGRRAILCRPDPVFYANVGRAYQRLGEENLAEEHYKKGIELFPDHPACHRLYAHVLMAREDFNLALEHAARAYELAVDQVDTAITLAAVYEDRGEMESAAMIYSRASGNSPTPQLFFLLAANLVLQGQDATAVQNLVKAFVLEGRTRTTGLDNYFRRFVHKWYMLETAVSVLESAVSSIPSNFRAYGNAKIRSALMQITSSHKKFVVGDFENQESYSQYLLDMHYSKAYTQEEIYRAHCLFNEKFAVGDKPNQKFTKISREANRVLNVGYLSQDFRQHSVAYFIEPVIALHDPSKIRVFCYYNASHEDNMTARFRQYSKGAWRHCHDWSDEKLVAAIRRDKIDILVDLMGHSGSNRILVFGQKPAPVQISYLGYPDTTGLTAMDYRFTDQWVEPEGIAESFSREQLIRMENTYFCYRPCEIQMTARVHELPALANGYVTFGSFNAYQKITDEMIGIWAEILRRVPNSKLLLKVRLSGDVLRDFRPVILQRFEMLGIDKTRLLIWDFVRSLELSLQIYHEVDVCLDTNPYSGATTTCESLWMGCPVVSWYAQTHASRMSLSILSAVGLNDMAVDTAEAYIGKAVALAQDPGKLQRLRATMRERMIASPLMDATGFTRELESIYRNIWQNWCAANP